LGHRNLDAGGTVALSVGQPPDETGRAFSQTVDRLQRADELCNALAIDVINRDPNGRATLRLDIHLFGSILAP
jgi:hypothetical protein